MGQNLNAYQPTPGSGTAISLAGAGSTQGVAVIKGNKQVCIVVTAPATGVNVRINPPGDATAANASDQLVVPGFPRVFTKDADGVLVSLFCGAGGGTGQVTSGNGVS